MDIFTPKKLYKKGCCINLLIHPFRNNPRYRFALYRGFISWVGINNWERVKPEVKNSWESAANSFDKLLGLLKVYKTYTNPNDLLLPQKQVGIDEGLKKCIKIMSILKSYNETKPSVVEYKCLIDLLRVLIPDETDGKAEIIDYLDSLKEKDKSSRCQDNVETAKKESPTATDGVEKRKASDNSSYEKCECLKELISVLLDKERAKTILLYVDKKDNCNI